MHGDAMIGVSVVVDDGHADDLGRVAEALRAHGMTVDALLDEIGMITGFVPPDGVPLLQTVAGVASVTTQHGVRLAPPDADIQ